jgi:hypothetical protein
MIRFVRLPRGRIKRIEWGTRRLAVEVDTEEGPRWMVAGEASRLQSVLAPVLRILTVVRLPGGALVVFRPHPAGIPYALDALLFWRRPVVSPAHAASVYSRPTTPVG